MNATILPTLDTANHRPRRAWWLFCVFFYGLAVFNGARHALVTASPAFSDLLFPIVMSICLCSWALADARERGRPVARSLQIWYYFLAPLVVPAYLVQTRGWKGLAWIALHAIAWMVTATVAMHVIGRIYWGDIWWRSLGLE